MRKITRILGKTLLYLCSIILLLVTTLYFLIQSYSFQTWAAQKASDYLSSELKTEVSIQKLELDFFHKLHLHGVFIKDQKQDTLLYSDFIGLDLKEFNYKQKVLDIRNIVLANSTAKLIKYKGEKDFNFQFLADYFAGDNKPKEKDTTAPWVIKHNHFTLNNVQFEFSNRNKEIKKSKTIDFDHLRINELSGNFSDLAINEDTISVALSHLHLIEKSGFHLHNLSSYVKFSPTELLCKQLILQTPGTYLSGRLQFTYDSLSAYNDFINKVNMKIDLNKKTQAYIPDIAYFVEELYGLEDTAFISGKVRGTVSDISLQYFSLRIKDHTEFVGDVSMIGLPDINNSYLHIDAKKLTTNYKDLIAFHNYPFHEKQPLQIPSELKPLGDIFYVGKFDGLINDFNIYGNIRTQIGSLTTDIGIKTGEKADDLQYHGRIKTDNLNIGTVFGMSDFNHLACDISLDGKGVNLDKIHATLEGKINSITYNQYNYNNIRVDGSFIDKSFNGLLISSDPNADFDFNGSIHFINKMPDFDFISTVNNLNLKALNFTNDEASFSTQILITLNGDNLNNLSGNVNFDNTNYTIKDKKYKISTFDLTLDQVETEKKIHLSSNYFNFDMDGNFALTNLPLAFRQIMHDYYPAFVKKNKGKTIYQDEFKFSIKIKKFNTIQELFVNSLDISPNTLILGDFDASKNLINFNLDSKLIDLAGIKFHDNKIESFSKDHKINLVFKGKDIQLTDSVKLDNYFMYLVSQDFDTKFNLEWNNQQSPNNSGKLFGKLSFTEHKAKINLETLNINVKDSLWTMVTSNPTYIDSSGGVIVEPLKFASGKQEIAINGHLSKSVHDSLNFVTKNLVLDQFNAFLSPYSIKLSGNLDGNIRIKKENQFITVNSLLNFNSFLFNDNLIGELLLSSDYITKENRIALNGHTTLGLRDLMGNTVKNLSFYGNYYLDKKDESIDIEFLANPLNLRLINPLTEGIFSVKQGFVKGKGKVHGTPDNILLEGDLDIFKTEIKVDYTNVSYDVTGKIEIMPDQIRFSDLLLKDPLALKAAPQGTINGNIFHRKFKNMQLDYDITFNKMLLLNTQEKDNPDFFGTIYGSGNIGIWGFMNDIYMQVRATADKASEFVLPLDGPEEVAENDFITFVKKDTVKVEEKTDLTGFNLDLKIKATDKLQTKILFDRTNNDLIKVYGNGEISMTINTLGKFEMYGDYIIDGGDYNFNLENVISKKFEIDGGSSISWSGDPMNAEIDVTASYRQRASIAPLINDATGAYKGRTPAACQLKMKNKLMSPDISFALEFPNISDNVRSQINNVLTDEQELNRQVFSFLIFRSFVPPLIYNTTGGGVTAGNAAASTGSELLSNRLSNMLDNVVGNFAKDLQVGVNYRPGSQNNSDEVLMNINKTYFDDKLTIDGNIGMGSGTSGNRNFIGDVNIEYKLSDDGRYKLKGFNRTNDNTQLITSGGLYTQGIGFFFREEFDTFSELASRYKKKFKSIRKKDE